MRALKMTALFSFAAAVLLGGCGGGEPDDGMEMTQAEPTAEVGEPLRSDWDEGRLYFGTVKWYNAEKGYGFITAEEGDAFFHYSNVVDHEHCTSWDLTWGIEVRFRPRVTTKGVRAFEVVCFPRRT